MHCFWCPGQTLTLHSLYSSAVPIKLTIQSPELPFFSVFWHQMLNKFRASDRPITELQRGLLAITKHQMHEAFAVVWLQRWECHHTCHVLSLMVIMMSRYELKRTTKRLLINFLMWFVIIISEQLFTQAVRAVDQTWLPLKSCVKFSWMWSCELSLILSHCAVDTVHLV